MGLTLAYKRAITSRMVLANYWNRPNIVWIVIVLIFKCDIVFDPIDEEETFQNVKGLEESELKNNRRSKNNLFSSVWCKGTNHSSRQCRFHNLCYNPLVNDFVFFKGKQSFEVGVPDDRFSPTLADFSSVENHNKMYFNYVELPSEFSSRLNVEILDGCALILKRFNPENLMHVFHDDLLPIYFSANEIGLLGSNLCDSSFLVFADDREPGPYSMLYDILFKTKPFYLSSVDKKSIYCFTNAFVGLSKHTTWYQYGFRQPQGSLNKDYSHMPNIIEKFVDHYKQHFKIKNEVSNCTVLFSRKQNRKILNEMELIRNIEAISSTKVSPIDVNDDDIADILSKITKCPYLIGMHGAALILSLFLRKGSTVIEMFPYAISEKYYTPYRTLLSILGKEIKYYSWENKIRSNSFPNSQNLPEFGSISHLSPEEQNWIKSIESVKPQACCYNPEWLYYIYQDTLVDIDSFSRILRHAKSDIDASKTELESSIESEKIHPSTVQRLTCKPAFDKDGKNELSFHISWRPPWNLLLMNITALEYELWLQISKTDDVKAFITNRTNFTVFHSSADFLIWVRCIANGYNGPFTSNPLICLESFE